MPEKPVDPVDYPTITVNGEDVPLKFRQYDLIQLAKKKINLAMEKAEDRPNPLSVEGMERTFEILAAGVAHKVAISAEELSKQYEFGEVMNLNLAIAASIKKAVSQIDASIPVEIKEAIAKAAEAKAAQTLVEAASSIQ